MVQFLQWWGGGKSLVMAGGAFRGEEFPEIKFEKPIFEYVFSYVLSTKLELLSVLEHLSLFKTSIKIKQIPLRHYGGGQIHYRGGVIHSCTHSLSTVGYECK